MKYQSNNYPYLNQVENWWDRLHQDLVKITSTIELQDIISIEMLNYPLVLLDDIVLDLKPEDLPGLRSSYRI